MRAGGFLTRVKRARVSPHKPHHTGLNVADKVPGPGSELAVARPRIIINCAPASDNDIYPAKMQIVISSVT